MKNSEYWKKRFELLEQSQNRQALQCYADIERQYRQTLKKIEGQIAVWYQRFADNNGVTMQEARRLLNSKELEELKWDVRQYIRHGKANEANGAWMKQLENASARFHISRLESLKLQMQQSLETMFGNQLDSIDSAMRNIYKSEYYHTAFELQKGIGIGWDFATLDEKKISKVINKPWAADGKNFSQRVWSNRRKLVNELNMELTRNIMLGQDPKIAISAIARKMKTSQNAAGRLVMTESAFFSSAAQKDCFNELDVELFEIVATLDSHTSEICRKMDGKVFPMSKWEVGVTAPPFHVWCRTTTAPAFNDEFDNVGKRAARGKDGKVCYVSADMTYEEWEETYVKEQEADYLARNHVSGQDTSKERKILDEAVSSMPQKVQDALGNTVIDVGKDGASQYDYVHDILYLAKGADKKEVIHEIGHMVENKLLDSDKVALLKQNILGQVMPNEFTKEVYYDAGDNPIEIFLVKSEKFVSDYQGRVYINDWSELLDGNMNVRQELLQEFISESFREYIENPQRLKERFPEFYKLIMEAVE